MKAALRAADRGRDSGSRRQADPYRQGGSGHSSGSTKGTQMTDHLIEAAKLELIELSHEALELVSGGIVAMNQVGIELHETFRP
jgi:hypothetical protein